MLIPNAIALLQDLIRLESFSGAEEATATRIEQWLSTNGIPFQRKDNNVWATNKSFDPQKPTLLLNSHHDTVQPNQGYTRNPFSPDIEGGNFTVWGVMMQEEPWFLCWLVLLIFIIRKTFNTICSWLPLQKRKVPERKV